jgi:hypothetical protein
VSGGGVSVGGESAGGESAGGESAGGVSAGGLSVGGGGVGGGSVGGMSAGGVSAGGVAVRPALHRSGPLPPFLPVLSMHRFLDGKTRSANSFGLFLASCRGLKNKYVTKSIDPNLFRCPGTLTTEKFNNETVLNSSRFGSKLAFPRPFIHPEEAEFD